MRVIIWSPAGHYNYRIAFILGGRRRHWRVTWEGFKRGARWLSWKEHSGYCVGNISETASCMSLFTVYYRQTSVVDTFIHWNNTVLNHVGISILRNTFWCHLTLGEDDKKKREKRWAEGSGSQNDKLSNPWQYSLAVWFLDSERLHI